MVGWQRCYALGAAVSVQGRGARGAWGSIADVPDIGRNWLAHDWDRCKFTDVRRMRASDDRSRLRTQALAAFFSAFFACRSFTESFGLFFFPGFSWPFGMVLLVC